MIYGIDVSDYQPKVDWNYLKSVGVEFAIIKATQGNYHKQKLYKTHLDGANKAGLITGLYHWHDPLETYESQAEWFIKHTTGLDFQIAACDVEQQWADWQEWANGKITKYIPPQAISDNAKNVLAYWDDRLKQKTVLYTRTSFINSYARPMLKWCGNYPLWLAHYPYANGRIAVSWEEFKEKHLPQISGPDLPQGCTDWRIWQFSGDKFLLPGVFSDAAGKVLSPLDVNFWNGTIGELHTFAGVNLPAPEPEPEPENPPAEEEPPMTVSGLALGAWLSPDRTPYVDFDQLKAGGVEFIVALVGAGVTGDPLIDRKPTKIDGVDWYARVVEEAYRIDVPLFAQWDFHPEHGTNTDQAPKKQMEALTYLLENKTVHGLFNSVVFKDQFGKAIAPFWVKERWMMFNDMCQKKYPGFWVGPVAMNWRGQPDYWTQLEPQIGKNGVPGGTGPALCWIEGMTTARAMAWKDLEANYPVTMPKNLPADPANGDSAFWWIWAWSLNIALPGMWMDKEKKQTGKPWLCFFHGDKAALHRFAFYTSHGYTAPGNSDPQQPPVEQEEPENELALLKRIAAAVEKMAGVIK